MQSLLAPCALALAVQLSGGEDPAAPLSRTTHRLPHLGTVVVEERRLDPASGLVVRTARDEQGRAVDVDALLTEERLARIASNQKMSPELAARAAAAAPGQRLDVVFWLTEPEGLDLHAELQARVASGEAVAEARQAVLATARSLFEPRNQAFARRVQEAGHEILLVGDFWPDVFARLPASEIARWAAAPEVDLAYYAFSEGGPEQDDAQGTMRTFNVHDLGITGAVGATKVLVNDCGEVTTTHSWLPPVTKMTTNAVQSHPCGVAGNICMNGPVLQAAAKGLPQLYSADGCGSDAPAQAAWSWGLSQGIDVGNCSWWNGNKGSIVFLDRYFDYTIRNYSVMLFKSNGNQGGTGSPTSTSPGNGYNVTCSGAYNDADDSSWANDAMASYSSYQNPVEGHEKPELASPGDGTVSTSTGGTGTQSFNGTSSASPLTCGVGVLLLNENPALLASMPALRAALMVGAWHNVEGAVPLSDKDGAGGVHAAASHQVIRRGQFENGSFTNASFPSGYYDKQVQLYGGVETRVIAVWLSDPDAAYATDQLKMDLDLTVRNPAGQVVASSANAFNPFELVYFTPATSGIYTVRLTRQKFLGTSEPYAIAWSTKMDAGVGQVTFTGTPTHGTNLQINFRERYDPSVGYVGVASLGTLPAYIGLGNGWGLPVQNDRWARFTMSGQVSGFLGTLNGSGQATGFLPLPNDAGFAGTTMYVSMFTHNVGNPSAVRGVAPAASFVIQ